MSARDDWPSIPWGDIVGYWPDVVGAHPLTQQTSTEPCTAGCLAPGSSAHFHTKVVGWRVILPDAVIDVGLDMIPTRSRVLHHPTSAVPA